MHLARDRPSRPPGFDLTEAGTQKRLAVYLVRDPARGPRRGPARAGRAAPSTSTPSPRGSAGQRGQIKGVLTDQSVLAGVGNAYSDEILHAARLSPFAIAARLTDDAGQRPARRRCAPILTDAVARSVGQRAATLKGEKRSGLRGARPHRAAVPGLR